MWKEFGVSSAMKISVIDVAQGQGRPGIMGARWKMRVPGLSGVSVGVNCTASDG